MTSISLVIPPNARQPVDSLERGVVLVLVLDLSLEGEPDRWRR